MQHGKRVLVLGGYGNFGKRIVESLANLDGVTLIIAGRDISRASILRDELVRKALSATFEAVALDIFDPEFEHQLKQIAPNIVIHTGGPFQGQNYRVPQACISVGSHYIDLADDRRFVCDIHKLNADAIRNHVLVISGASSVPGLSSSVVDHFAPQFSRIDEIDFAIAPGNKAERGEATVRGILSYTGHAFKVLRHNEWVDAYGWLSPRTLFFDKEIGKRFLADIDIPDLELFPQRYPSVKTVRFQAGLELPMLHYGMVFMAYVAKLGLIKNWASFTKPIFKASELLMPFGTDIGGMQINLRGANQDGQRLHVKWVLGAKDGVGPYIPTLSATILTKKLLSGELSLSGAMPCLGLYTLHDFDDEAKGLGIYHHMEQRLG
ncbi:saccharopine dehydrogenase NADP-binding domain-containing protein [Thalassolituus oleivorans]|uniref:saccharopine dehydrogenase NADP-binding domain-containing protein n=1 Tax=Thalassolituus oleivorans TaxID=187493 RepID=UPI00094922E0|nr:saccharopine dehydrogenase NADP-binding domain-containing protein [Thalassolituus oleivorans]APR68363.1 saccharopine dehydrogenase [Thalassolituus oleivorans]MCA6128435.1 saccharopine dehydrogenase [Thalassolituus oleivorans 4BN06-13]